MQATLTATSNDMAGWSLSYILSIHYWAELNTLKNIPENNLINLYQEKNFHRAYNMQVFICKRLL